MTSAKYVIIEVLKFYYVIINL